MSQSYEVDTDALAAHASTLSDLADQLQQASDTAGGVNLSSDAYGQVGEEFVPTATEVAQAGQDALRNQVAALQTASTGMSGMVTAYQQQETGEAAQFGALGNDVALNPGPTTTAADPPASTPVDDSLAGQQLAQNTPGPPPQFDLKSPGDNTTITMPDGKTIPVKPGGEYIVPDGSIVTKEGVNIADSKTNPHGFVMQDGTKVLLVDPDKVPKN